MERNIKCTLVILSTKKTNFLKYFTYAWVWKNHFFTEWAWGNRSSLYNNFVMLMWFGWIGN